LRTVFPNSGITPTTISGYKNANLYHPPVLKYSNYRVALVFIYLLKKIMGDLLYIIAVILIIGWLLGAFVFSAGSIIHLLLVIAIIAILLRLIRGRSV
jgi:hypothetical protein